MRYSTQITAQAEQELLNASDYIEFSLMNPDAADALLDAFEEKVYDIASYPKKYPLAQDAVLASWGLRYTLFKNYIIAYVIDEENTTVHIIRFLYQKSNWLAILKSDYSV